MVFYAYDPNYIFMRPLKSKQAHELNHNVKSIISILTQKGFTPKYWILDNEISNLVKATFQEQEIQYQLVPPGVHRKMPPNGPFRLPKHI